MLKVYEKICDGEEVWYEEITEDPKGLPNAFYALVEFEGKHLPLPWFFPWLEYTGLGGILDTNLKQEFQDYAKDLPGWVEGYVYSWTRWT